jgi:hypothetical protein
MPATWTTFRLLCCAPPELQEEKWLFHAVNARFSERAAMPRRILFALGSSGPAFDPRLHRQSIEDNLRFCDFFVQFFGETASDPAYAGFVELAMARRADPACSMRSVAAMFRNPEAAGPETAALRRRWLESGQCVVRDFHDAAEFDRAAEEILETWFGLVKSGPLNSPGV